jgi:hypothetical protein
VVAFAGGFRAPFYRYWLSGFLADFGNGVRLAAFPLLAAQLTRSPAAIAAVTTVQGLPWLLLGTGAASARPRSPPRRSSSPGGTARPTRPRSPQHHRPDDPPTPTPPLVSDRAGGHPAWASWQIPADGSTVNDGITTDATVSGGGGCPSAQLAWQSDVRGDLIPRNFQAAVSSAAPQAAQTRLERNQPRRCSPDGIQDI